MYTKKSIDPYGTPLMTWPGGEWFSAKRTSQDQSDICSPSKQSAIWVALDYNLWFMEPDWRTRHWQARWRISYSCPRSLWRDSTREWEDQQEMHHGGNFNPFQT